MCAFGPVREIQTPRLTLRGPVAVDAPVIATLANDEGVAGMTSQMPYPYALADAQAFLARAGRADPSQYAQFAIEHRQHGYIGGLGLFPRDRPGPEIGYWLGRPHWGQGYATEAVEAALGWAASAWRRRLVVAGHFADNPASGQVLIKAGFLYTGEVEARPSAARGGEAVPTRLMVWLA